MLARLGRALAAREAERPEAFASIRLLALTGCRISDALNLRWRDIGEDANNLSDSETGPRVEPLGQIARAHVAALPNGGDPGAFLFPCHAKGLGTYSLATRRREVCAGAKPGSLRLTAASQAVIWGEGLPLAGGLLGHCRLSTIAGCAYLADAHVIDAAEGVCAIIAAVMESGQTRGCGSLVAISD